LYSFVIDVSACLGAADGFQITNGTDFLSILRSNANKLNVTSEFEAFYLNVARDVTIDSGTLVAIGTGAGGFTVNTTQLVMDQTTGYLGLGVAVPSGMIAMNGESNRTMGVERRIAAGSIGRNLSIVAGSATVGATDKNGGTLNLVSGISTGSGSSSVVIYAYPAGAPGVADNTPLAMISCVPAALAFADSWKAGSTYAGSFILAAASAEWTAYETNFGEVSLLNALNQAVTIGNASTVTVADTTSAACYVGLFEAATGNIAAKTDGGLLYNAVTGSLGLGTATFDATAQIVLSLATGIEPSAHVDDAVQLYSFEAAGAILGVWDEIGIVAGKTASADEYMAVRYCGQTRWLKLYNTPA
jgi:hypothetical protein